jgi:hypothetical protein
MIAAKPPCPTPAPAPWSRFPRPAPPSYRKPRPQAGQHRPSGSPNPLTSPGRRHRRPRAGRRAATAANSRRRATGHQPPASGTPARQTLLPAPTPLAPPGPAASSQLAAPPSTYRRLPAANSPRDTDDHDALRLALADRCSKGHADFLHSTGWLRSARQRTSASKVHANGYLALREGTMVCRGCVINWVAFRGGRSIPGLWRT